MLVNINCDIPDSCESCKYLNDDGLLIYRDYCQLTCKWYFHLDPDVMPYPEWCPIIREEPEPAPVPMLVANEHPSENVINQWVGNCPKCDQLVSTKKEPLSNFCRICGQPILWTFSDRVKIIDVKVSDKPIIDIEAAMPHKVSETICLLCKHRCIDVRPEHTKLKDLECPQCGRKGFMIETGEDILEGD